MTRPNAIRARIASVLSQPPERLRDDVLLSDLIVESLLLVELAIDLQEEFGVRLGHDELAGVRTVGDLIRLVAGPARTSKLVRGPGPTTGDSERV